MSDFAAHMTPSPGSFIAEELEARGWTQLDLAFVLGVTTQAINQIIQGKRGIGSEMAKALGKAFDVPPEFFLNLQAAWDLAKSRDPDPAVKETARALPPFNPPLRPRPSR